MGGRLGINYFFWTEEIDLKVHFRIGQHEGLTDFRIIQSQFLEQHTKQVHLGLIAGRNVRGDAEGPLPRQLTCQFADQIKLNADTLTCLQVAQPHF